ncbi:MAG: allophanate hydrolase subunit 1, partial [Pseudorhodoplanes sp.]
MTSPLIPEVLPAGPAAVLVRFALTPDPAAMSAALALAADIAETPPQGLGEVVPALVSVLVEFDSGCTDRATLARDLAARAARIATGSLVLPRPGRRWTIPVAFGGSDGPQLEETAVLAGLSPAATVAELCAAELRILTIGFAPGQPYIGLLPPSWDIPRRAQLNPSVPAGAIVLAVRQIVMFSAASATGWRQVGRAAFRSFVPGRDIPMPLRAGDAVRFAQADMEEIDRLSAE